MRDDFRHEVNQKISTVEAWLAERGKGHALAAIRSTMADLDDEEKALTLHVLNDEVLLRVLSQPRPLSEV